MAIIIPSKHIYSKSFDPVIDNNISKVEADVNEPKIIGNTDNVYTENFNSVFIKGNMEQSQDADKFVYRADNGNMKGSTSIVYVKIQPTYIRQTIKIPELQYSKKILSVFGGIDNNGNPNISTNITGIIEKGTINGTIDMAISSESPSYALIGYGIDISENNKTEEKNASYSLSHENETYEVMTNSQTQSGNRPLTASVTINNKDTILNSNFNRVQENGEWFFVCTLTCLAGLSVEKFAVYYSLGTAANDGTPIDSANKQVLLHIPIEENSIENSYEVYTPQTIHISASGETIELNLDEETIKIGSGNKVFSFDGNELIQTTNMPSVESKYQEIIDHWKNGKQTAVISCPIADYYDENGNLAISTTGIVTIRFVRAIGNTLRFQEVGTKHMKVGITDITSTLGEILTINVTKIYDDYSFDALLIRGQSSSLQTYAIYTTDRFLSAAKLIFHEGDIVIPYTYTNKGDKPLSYNKDFTPKQFKIVGTKISKNQGGTQQLTLQEV